MVSGLFIGARQLGAGCVTGGPSSQCYPFFSPFYANVQSNVTHSVPIRADLTRFRRVIVLWVSTTKRKTRPDTDFRSTHRSRRINPLKITLPAQFLRSIEEEMLKFHVSSPATRFRPQRLHYETFISRLLRSQIRVVETHRTITRRNRVRSARGAGKQQRIQHSNRVSRFYSQNIRIIDFSIKTVAFPYKPL